MISPINQAKVLHSLGNWEWAGNNSRGEK